MDFYYATLLEIHDELNRIDEPDDEVDEAEPEQLTDFDFDEF
jgi:hypothetical protein